MAVFVGTEDIWAAVQAGEDVWMAILARGEDIWVAGYLCDSFIEWTLKIFGGSFIWTLSSLQRALKIVRRSCCQIMGIRGCQF